MTGTPAAPHDESFTPEVLSSSEVYRGAVWGVREDRVRYGDGEIVRQQYRIQHVQHLLSRQGLACTQAHHGFTTCVNGVADLEQITKQRGRQA